MHFARFCLSLLIIGVGCLRSPELRAITLEEIEIRTTGAVLQVTDPVVRQQVEQLYQQARTSLESRAGRQAKLDTLRKAAARYPQTRRDLLDEVAELERAKSTPPVTQRERTLDAAALENLIDLTRAERTALESKLGAHELRLRTLTARPAELEKERAAVAARLAQIDAERSQLTDEAADPLSQARLAAYDAENEARQVELELLNQEQLGHEGLREITTLRREVALLNLERLSARTTALEELLIERREASLADLQASAQQATTDTQKLSPAAQAIANESARQSAELASLVKAQGGAVRLRAEYAEQRQRLNTEYENSRQRLQIAGTSSVLGRLLVDQGRRLPNVRALMQQAKSNADEVSRVSLRRIEIEEQLRALATAREDPAALVAPGRTDSMPTDEAVKQIQSLLSAQESLLRNLDTNYAAYLRVLDAADGELQQLIDTVSAYTELLNRRLLWIPNAPLWSVEMLVECASTLRGLLAVEPWADVATGLQVAMQTRPVRVLAWVALLILAYRARPRFRVFLAALAERQQAPGRERVRDAFSAMCVMGFIALPLPLLCYVVANVLQISPDASPLALALSQTLKFSSLLLLIALWWREALAEGGLLEAHFGVGADVIRDSRRAWMMFVQSFVPSYALALHFDWQSSTAAQSGLTRVLFAIAMLSLLAFNFWLTRRVGVLLRLTFGPVLESTRLFCQLALLTPPLLFGALSAAGYHYTAVELSRYFLLSGLLIAVAILGYRASLKWLRLANARLRASESPKDGEGTGAAAPAEIAKFDAQARLLVQNVIGWALAFGLLAVWQTVLPALAVLDNVNLWSITIKDANGVVTPQAITIASVALAALIGLVTIMASRNLPGLLEFSLLQRLRVTRGSRYAITSLLQYAIVAVGLTIVLSTLGLQWSQVQWLVAALGVGLGFGLQEIFANFISGLILLFERPIRVGDVVTIGDMTGQVTTIRIRATTIKDADGKEIVVPNKTFITERFLNWTLSDQVTRIVLQVGIAYGADLELAIRLLLEIAKSHPKVMRDPAPQAVLTAFGDSALTLELQVHAEELKHRVDLRHELNRLIYEAFRTHGIEIPFPQRDIHIRTQPAPASANDAVQAAHS